MTNQRQDFHDQETVPHKHLYKLSMRHSQGEDLYFQEQSRQRQKSKIRKNEQIRERI